MAKFVLNYKIADWMLGSEGFVSLQMSAESVLIACHVGIMVSV